MTTTPPEDDLLRAVPRPNQGVWPGLAAPPRSPGRARIAATLFRRAVRDLDVQVMMAGGERLGAGGPDAPVMRVHRPDAFFHRLGANSKIGFGESYMVGDWTSNELADLLTPFAARLSTLISPTLQRIFRRYVEARQPREEQNTVEGSRENISRHYDLSNDLFATFLDETMSYSAAWFAEGAGDSPADLAAAQLRKIDGILDLAGVTPGQHVLEIGTGWGGLATRAAQRGARVTTLTISAEQARLAEERLAAAGVADRVQVLLRDYREAHGSYDAIVSVEMIEAVGEKYWPTYFGQLDRLLRPGGRVGLQSITMPHDRMLASRGDYSWIHKYVFPGAQYGHADTLLGLELFAVLGVAFWVLGFVFETVGDAQLAAFKADPASHGQVLDSGLWRYTRHPNYFGDASVWWGLALLGLHHLPGLAGLLSAGLMTFLLARGTGARLLESTIGDRRPGYADYIARTSGFIPLPPRT